MRVANIQRFCMHDGPGVRTTDFLKGCPLHCSWCHNPETQSTKPELLFYRSKCIGCGACAACERGAHVFSNAHTLERSLCAACGQCADACPTGALELVGREYTPEALLEIIERDRAFYGKHGGVTLSGGEPLWQAEETLALLRLCRAAGLHTALETCGFFPADLLDSVVPLTDLFLWDIKDTDPDRHKSYTGVSNEQIIENLIRADRMGARTRIRCILLGGINTDETHYRRIAELYAKLSHCEGVELIPLHLYGDAKSAALDRPVHHTKEQIPTPQTLDSAKKYLSDRGVTLCGSVKST